MVGFGAHQRYQERKLVALVFLLDICYLAMALGLRVSTVRHIKIPLFCGDDGSKFVKPEDYTLPVHITPLQIALRIADWLSSAAA